jgi:hypothetical protein
VWEEAVLTSSLGLFESLGMKELKKPEQAMQDPA